MKKSGFLLLTIFFCLIPACKSPPPATNEPGPEAVEAAEAAESAEAANAAEAAESVEAVEAANAAESVEAANAAEVASAAEAAESAENVEAANAAETAESVEAVENVEAVEAAESAETAEATESPGGEKEASELPVPDTSAEEVGEALSADTPDEPGLSGIPSGNIGGFPAADPAESAEPDDPAETEPELAGISASPPEAEPVLPEPDASSLLPPPEPVLAEDDSPAGIVREPEPRPAAPVPPPPESVPSEEDSPAGIVREPEPRPVAPVPARPEPEISPLAPRLDVSDEHFVFSRIVRATVGQVVEIPFRGTGWVYLGELGARRGVNYDSRRLDSEGQSFIFRAEAAGVYALKFYKQDFLRDYILNDYVQVIVGEAPEASTGWFNPPLDRGRVSAERWPSSLEEADAIARSRTGAVAGSVPAIGSVPAEDSVPAETAPAGPVESPLPTRPAIDDEGIVPVRPPVAAGQPETAVSGREPRESSAETGSRASPPEGSPPGDYLRRAREEFDAGRVAGAIAVLDQFREQFPAGSDEAWWLYGQFYEANSPSRDIRAALDYYRRLVREYPQSRRYNDARRRIAYLERYYINIQ